MSDKIKPVHIPEEEDHSLRGQGAYEGETLVHDISNATILKTILFELRVINVHLRELTDLEVEEEDMDKEWQL